MHFSPAIIRGAALGSVLALAAVAPTAAFADEPLRLDTAELDTVTAGLELSLAMGSIAAANGTLFSSSNQDTLLVGNATPAVGVITGTTVATAVAIGGDAPAAATTLDPIAFEGTVIVNRSGTRNINRGFVDVSVSWQVVVVADDELGIFN